MNVSESDHVGFSAYLLTRNCKQSTVKRHLKCLSSICHYAPTLDTEGFNQLIVTMRSLGRKNSTINILLETLNAYCDFKGLPRVDIKWLKRETVNKVIMSDDEITNFLAVQPCRKQENWHRFQMMWELLCFTGARPSEICNLTHSSVDWGREVLQVDGKTGPRLIPIPPNIKNRFKDYYNASGDVLFPSLRCAGTLGSEDWNYNFRYRVNKLGIYRPGLTPYSLRHSFICNLLDNDANLFSVQDLVGHKRGSPITSSYYHLTVKAIKNTLNKHSLIQRSTDPRNILSILKDTFNKLFEKDPRFEKSIIDKGDEVIIRIKIRKS